MGTYEHSIAQPRTADVPEPRAPLARRTYDNIYPLYAHDPQCHCCHPNDRPYCDCHCHRGPGPGEWSLMRTRWSMEGHIPCAPPTPLTNRMVPQTAPPPSPDQRRYLSLARGDGEDA